MIGVRCLVQLSQLVLPTSSPLLHAFLVRHFLQNIDKGQLLELLRHFISSWLTASAL